MRDGRRKVRTRQVTYPGPLAPRGEPGTDDTS
ncbi:hypothetical protein EYF80_067691 [Liparis tanakae]|uniref:Uncharacterized protein n=1 Tax=Liparis tanakae TaxID=230148 RepID=A0A4Z2E0A4_9TELE|nr:hypothetical protein EYF80_067691 [Liparis tanakae]